MNYTISMTDILLAVSVGCNLWFLFLLLYERIMDTRIVRFFKGIVGLWRSLDGNEAKRIAAHEEVPAEKRPDIIGKSRFRMASTRTTAAIPTQEAAIEKKALSCRRKRLLLTTETRKSHHARHRSRRRNSMKPSRACRLRNWNTGRMSRTMTNWTKGRLREAASRTSTWQSGRYGRIRRLTRRCDTLERS